MKKRFLSCLFWAIPAGISLAISAQEITREEITFQAAIDACSIGRVNSGNIDMQAGLQSWEKGIEGKGNGISAI